MPVSKHKSPDSSGHAAAAADAKQACKMDVKSQSPIKPDRPSAGTAATSPTTSRTILFSVSAPNAGGSQLCQQCRKPLVSPFRVSPCRRTVCSACVRVMKSSSAPCASCAIGCQYHAFDAQGDHAKAIASGQPSAGAADDYMLRFVTDARELQSTDAEVMHSGLIRGILALLTAQCVIMRIKVPSANSLNLSEAGAFADVARGNDSTIAAIVDYMKRVHGCTVVTT